MCSVLHIIVRACAVVNDLFSVFSPVSQGPASFAVQGDDRSALVQSLFPRRS